MQKWQVVSLKEKHIKQIEPRTYLGPTVYVWIGWWMQNHTIIH